MLPSHWRCTALYTLRLWEITHPIKQMALYEPIGIIWLPLHSLGNPVWIRSSGQIYLSAVWCSVLTAKFHNIIWVYWPACFKKSNWFRSHQHRSQVGTADAQQANLRGETMMRIKAKTLLSIVIFTCEPENKSQFCRNTKSLFVASYMWIFYIVGMKNVLYWVEKIAYK